MVQKHAQIRLVVLAAGLFVMGEHVSHARDGFYLWIEAEDFTSATEGIRLVRAERAVLPSTERKTAGEWLRRSGRRLGATSRVSGGAYVERKEHGRDDVEKIRYDFRIPYSGDYFIWVRFNDPPPCNSRFSLWLVSTLSF